MIIENIFGGNRVYVDNLINTQRIYVSSTAPSNPNINDIWVNIGDEAIGGNVSTKYETSLSENGSYSILAGTLLKRVLVKPSSSLTAFKLGNTSNGDELVGEIPLSAEWNLFNVEEYFEATGTIYLSGITSQTQIILYYE